MIVLFWNQVNSIVDVSLQNNVLGLEVTYVSSSVCLESVKCIKVRSVTS